jgi:uncharacterized membrane-anchored protein YhcB (DUF1043 family)
MDFKLFVDALLTGTPLAILAALVGIIWQAIYVRSRDKLHDGQIRRELELENIKFEYQKELETLKFEYEKRRWREELAMEVTMKIVEVRIEEYSKVWSYIEGIASHKLGEREINPLITKKLAEKIKDWRYSKGGLLAEGTTRDSSFALQTALWKYDGSEESYSRMRVARGIFRDAIRADIGLGEDIRGQTIFEAIEKRQKIREELEQLKLKLGINNAK